MRLKRLIFLGLGVVVLSGLWITKVIWDSSPKPKKPTTSYCISAPSVELSPARIPCLKIEINGYSLDAELDLGLSAYASATKGILDKISDKSLIGTTLMYGRDEKKWEENTYQIPKITIGQISFYDLPLQESSYEFESDAILIKTQCQEIPELARLGWHLFRKTTLFLDLSNATVLFCNSAETFSKQGYELKKFAATPLLLDRGRMEIEALTSRGPLRCQLDTGATLNIFHKDNPEEKSMEQMILDPENIEKLSSFQIGGIDLGPVEFHRLPIHFQIKTDAVLGMEFFLTHQVFIDFIEKQIYFAPTLSLAK